MKPSNLTQLQLAWKQKYKLCILKQSYSISLIPMEQVAEELDGLFSMTDMLTKIIQSSTATFPRLTLTQICIGLSVLFL